MEVDGQHQSTTGTLRSLPLSAGLGEGAVATIGREAHAVRLPVITNLVSLDEPGDTVHATAKGAVRA